MLDQLRDEIGEDDELQEDRNLVESGKLLEAADFSIRRLGEQRYYSLLNTHLRGVDCDVPEPHRILAQLPFAGVVTTNYDKPLERSYSASLPRAPTHKDLATLGPLLFDTAFFILKAHGDIDRPDTIVLTSNDYQRLIHANPAFSAIFSALLQTKSILFIGYSLNDPDFRLLLERQLTIFGGNVPPRYALMGGVSKIERDVLFHTAGIRVLPYAQGRHDEVLEFIRVMRDQLSIPPQPVVSPKSLPRAESRAKRTASIAVLAISAEGKTLNVSLVTGEADVRASGATPDFGVVATLMRNARYPNQVQAVAEKLSSCLPATILDHLKEVRPGQMIALQVSSELQVLPWEWISVSHELLVLRNPLVRMPIGLTDVSRGYPYVHYPARVLVVGDPSSANADLHLPRALMEARAIIATYGKHSDVVCDSLIGSAATFEAVANAFRSGNYDIVHFAGHAWFDDEPFLLLSNEVKLYSSDLRSMLSSRPPAILFLNTHYSFFMPPGAVREAAEPALKSAPGSVALGHPGFLEAAGKAGVGTLIGTFSGWLDDYTAEIVGVAFHKNFLDHQPLASFCRETRKSLLSNGLTALLRGGSAGQLAVSTPPRSASQETRRPEIRGRYASTRFWASGNSPEVRG